jgi:DNA-binding NarL/FixJ family response regulator
MSHHILCVDADESAREETVRSLRDELAAVDPVFETARTVSDAESLLARDTAAVITEYKLPDRTGFDLINTVREVCPDAGCVLYTDTDPATLNTDELRGAMTEYVGKESVFGTERLAQLLRTTIQARAQSSYPLPQNESERLATLRSYDLADTELVSSLNRVADVAATHFGVDSASINIIGEHSQEFLACYGTAEGWESMDREDSVCTFTILEDDHVMTVEDVTDDPRFESRSDALLGMGIRAYIGANLVTPTGLVIGTLCVYDDEPRSFSPADESFLRDLASVAMDLVEVYSRLDATATGGEEAR